MIVFEDDVLYTASNEWAKNYDGVVRVGIDDYSQSSLGDIVYVELAKPGSHVSAGKSFGKIEATKSVSDINAPVSGKISRINNEALKSPQILNIDPFGEGWLAEIQPEDLSQLENLMTAEAYKKFIL